MTPEQQAAFDKILSVQHERLPPTVQKLMFSPPLHTAIVTAAGDGFTLIDATALPPTAAQSLMPKLGIKSWRDSGSLRVIYDGVPLVPALEKILARPTSAQRILAQAWLQTGQPLQVHLMTYADFADISEVRFLAGPRDVRLISQCLRGASIAGVPDQLERMLTAVKRLVELLPQHSHIIDFACLPDGSLRVLEINPALSPKDLAALGLAG